MVLSGASRSPGNRRADQRRPHLQRRHGQRFGRGIADRYRRSHCTNRHPKLRRSLLFVAVTGEEKGLLGSKYFAAHPTVKPGSMVADLNMDMFLPLFPLRSVTVYGLNESDLGDADPRRGQSARRGRSGRSGAGAQHLHPQRSVQLHSPRRPRAGDESSAMRKDRPRRRSRRPG